MSKVLDRKKDFESRILAELSDVKKEIRNIKKIILQPEKELTEEEALKIIEEGDRAYREGKTIEHDEFIKREYPQYAHLLHKDHPKVSKSLSSPRPCAGPFDRIQLYQGGGC